jgi:hypothetical protein
MKIAEYHSEYNDQLRSDQVVQLGLPIPDINIKKELEVIDNIILKDQFKESMQVSLPYIKPKLGCPQTSKWSKSNIFRNFIS